jgi:hypothetical protein
MRPASFRIKEMTVSWVISPPTRELRQHTETKGAKGKEANSRDHTSELVLWPAPGALGDYPERVADRR